ncbi:MAG: hypothetical protein QXI13_02865 [Thermoplasmatales archaeon]
MDVTGVRWIGLKTNSKQRFSEMTDMFSKILSGWEPKYGADYTHFSNGHLMIEVYYEDAPADVIVCGLEVRDIEDAVSEIKKLGLNLIGEKSCYDGSCWQHFLMPDGTEWEVKQSSQSRP